MPDALPYPLAVARRAVLDPSVCPGCLHPLVERTCDACGLGLDGEAGEALWAASLAVAAALDRRATLVAALRPRRNAGAPAAGSPVLGAPVPGSPASGAVPAARGTDLPATVARDTWRAPAVLQGLGAALLAVAALVLVVYRWHDLAPPSQVLVVAAPALAALAAAPALRRRGLVDGAEAVGALGVALLLLGTWVVRRAGAAPTWSTATYAATAVAVLAVLVGAWGAWSRVRVGTWAAPALLVAAGAMATGPSATWAVVAACGVAGLVVGARAALPALGAAVPGVAVVAAWLVGVPSLAWLAATPVVAAARPGRITFTAPAPATAAPSVAGLLLGAAALLALGLVVRVLGPAWLVAPARQLAGAVGVLAALVVAPALGAAAGAEQPAATAVPLLVAAAAIVVLDPLLSPRLHPELRGGAAAALLLALLAGEGAAGWTAGALGALGAFLANASSWVAPPARAVARVAATLLVWGAVLEACHAAGGGSPLAVARITVTGVVGLAVALHGAGLDDVDDAPSARELLGHGVALCLAATLDTLTQPWDVPADAVLVVLGVALLAVGVRRLAVVPSAPSWPVLGPGVALVLAPVLLGGLLAPTGWRLAVAVSVGVGAVVAGAARRLQAPFVLGATGLAIVALQQVTPLATAVGWWPLVALGGAALLAVGLTFERRLRDARAALAYVDAMR